MSYAAIYEVTRSMRLLLHSQLTLRMSTAVVTLLPPGETLPESVGVNLYLYRVLESPFTRNQSWRGDRVTPPVDEPALGLVLYYLLTPLGTRPDESSAALGDDAHTMLGAAMLTLHENPVLNDIHVPGFDADAVLPDFLLNSYEQIKIDLLPTSLDEVSKIWATINKPYRLSVAYEVSLLELTPEVPPPGGGGIVLATDVNVITLDAPRLTALTPAVGALAHLQVASPPALPGTVTPNQLRIEGFGFDFAGQTPSVRIGGQRVAIVATPAPVGSVLEVDLPLNLDAGPQVDVRVTLNQRTSPPLTFTVRPWLASIKQIRTALDPARPADLKLALAGDGFTSPLGVRFEGVGPPLQVALDPGATDSQASVTIPSALANGLYQVRFVLNDPARSLSNARSLEVIPRVDSPIGVALVPRAGGPPVHRLTINGARLAGLKVQLQVDAAVYSVGFPSSPPSSATQLVVTLGRQLSPGPHQVAVQVDGHLSRRVELVV